MKQCSEEDNTSSYHDPDAASITEQRPANSKGACTEYSTFFVVSLVGLTAGFVKEMTGSMLDYWQAADSATLEYGYLLKTMLEVAPYAISVIASCVLAVTASFLGRKFALYVAAVCGIISGLLFSYIESSHVVCIFVARAFSSVIVTAGYMVCPLYMIEIVHDSTRGIFTTGCSTMIFGGMALAFSLERTIPYSLFCTGLIVMPATFAFIFFWVPESPYFLVCRGKTCQAERSLVLMRRENPELVESELVGICEMVKPSSNARSFPDSWVGIMTALCLFIIKATGGNTITLHICDLVCSSHTVTARDMHGVIIALKCISSFLGALAVDRAGRKMLLYLSYGGSCVVFLLISVSIFIEWGNYRLVVMVCICVFAVFNGLGYGSITALIALELTPVRSRCIMMALSVVVESILSICILVSQQPINNVLGPPVNYIIPTIGNGLGLLFVWLVIPETSHKSLKEIQTIQIS